MLATAYTRREWAEVSGLLGENQRVSSLRCVAGPLMASRQLMLARWRCASTVQQQVDAAEVAQASALAGKPLALDQHLPRAASDGRVRSADVAAAAAQGGEGEGA